MSRTGAINQGPCAICDMKVVKSPYFRSHKIQPWLAKPVGSRDPTKNLFVQDFLYKTPIISIKDLVLNIRTILNKSANFYYNVID